MVLINALIRRIAIGTTISPISQLSPSMSLRTLAVRVDTDGPPPLSQNTIVPADTAGIFNTGESAVVSSSTSLFSSLGSPLSSTAVPGSSTVLISRTPSAAALTSFDTLICQNDINHSSCLGYTSMPVASGNESVGWSSMIATSVCTTTGTTTATITLPTSTLQVFITLDTSSPLLTTLPAPYQNMSTPTSTEILSDRIMYSTTTTITHVATETYSGIQSFDTAPSAHPLSFSLPLTETVLPGNMTWYAPTAQGTDWIKSDREQTPASSISALPSMNWSTISILSGNTNSAATAPTGLMTPPSISSSPASTVTSSNMSLSSSQASSSMLTYDPPSPTFMLTSSSHSLTVMTSTPISSIGNDYITRGPRNCTATTDSSPISSPSSSTITPLTSTTITQPSPTSRIMSSSTTTNPLSSSPSPSPTQNPSVGINIFSSILLGNCMSSSTSPGGICKI